jgi:hypothetical protein
MVHPPGATSTKICRLGSLFIFLQNLVLCTVQFFLHYIRSPQIAKVSQQDLYSTQKYLLQSQQYICLLKKGQNNPLIVLIHSTYTKLGQSPYKNPNPKWIRFVHFLLDLISAGPRSNRSPSRCLSTFQLLCNSLSTL